MRALLDAAAVAKRLNCTPQHVRKLWERGQLPSTQLPSVSKRRKMRRVDPDVLEAWIASNTTNMTGEGQCHEFSV